MKPIVNIRNQLPLSWLHLKKMEKFFFKEKWKHIIVEPDIFPQRSKMQVNSLDTTGENLYHVR